MQDCDTLIVGGGIAGLSTAWHLGQAAARGVLVVEREAHLGARSTGQNAAILRTLDPDPLNTALGRRSRARLLDPPAGFSPVPLVDPCGLLLVAGPDHARELRRWVESAGSPGDTREVSPQEAARLAPHYAGPVAAGFFDAGEGRLDIAAMVEGFARGARRAGADIRTRAGVAELRVEGGRVCGARLADGTCIEARTTVIAAGGWADGLGAAAGSRVRFRPTRRHLLVTAPDRRIHRRWPVVWALGEEFYCRPESGGLLACACDQEDVTPDACPVDGRVCEVIAGRMARLLPSLADLTVAHFWCGMRTLTRDGRFAIGPDPDVEGLFWVAGLGGHGMVCAFEIGRIAAGLLGTGPVEPDLARDLDPARLRAAAA